MADRFKRKAQSEKPASKFVVRTLKSWFLALELQLETTNDPAVKTLLDQIDDLIGRTMATAKAGSTRRENQEGTTETGNPPATDPVI